MKVAALYLRKSSEDERSGLDGKSIERQREHASAFAEKRGWRVDPDCVYEDEGVSGAEFVNRHGLQRLLRDARRKPLPFQMLVIAEPSRLGREQIETAFVLKQITDAGVEVFGYLDGRPLAMTTAADKLMFSVQAMAAESERERGRQRVRDALVRKAKLGHVTGQQTYGYRLVRKGEHTEREIDDGQAAVVRRVFEMAAEGRGYNRITHALAADGVPAPGRRGWTKDIVNRMLRNEVYRGVASFGMTRSVDRAGQAGKRERVRPDEWVRADVPHLRIITDDLWIRVQARKAKTRAHYLRAPDGRLLGKPESGLVASHLLNGIARCSCCGGALTFMGNRGNPRYYCVERARRGPSFCASQRGVPVAELDSAVRDQLYDALVANPDVVAAWFEEKIARLQSELETQTGEGTRRAAVAKLEREVKNLVAGLAEGKGSPAIAAAIAEREAKLAALIALPSPAQRPSVVAVTGDDYIDLAPPPQFDRADFFATMKTIGGQWPISPLLNEGRPAQFRQVLRKLGVERIVVTLDADGKGWNFDGIADVGRLINNGTPPPGGPIINTLWAPAAAISTPRLACAWPRTSAKSRPSPLTGDAPAARSTVTRGISRSPLRYSTASWRVAMGTASTPATTLASAAFAAGTSRGAKPSRRACRATGRTPRTGRTLASSDSSPITSARSRRPGFTSPVAERMPIAIGRSKAAPSLRRSAGARLTVIRSIGNSKPALRMAARTRSRLSRTVESGSPTVVKEGRPAVTSTSTKMVAASIPERVAERTRASTRLVWEPHRGPSTCRKRYTPPGRIC